MGFGWGESEKAHQEVYQDGGGYDNQAKFSHELIAGGAAFEGFKLFEDHQRAQGKPVEHAFAKELLAGFVGGEVDKLAETKGMDFYDRERAQHQAKEGARNMYDEHYGDSERYDPDQRDRPEHFQRGESRRERREYGGGDDYERGEGRREGRGYGGGDDDERGEGRRERREYGGGDDYERGEGRREGRGYGGRDDY